MKRFVAWLWRLIGHLWSRVLLPPMVLDMSQDGGKTYWRVPADQRPPWARAHYIVFENHGERTTFRVSRPWVRPGAPDLND